MKRTITMCLVTMLMLSLTLAVYGETNYTDVTYTVNETCTVTIPDEVKMSESGASFSMVCTKNNDKSVAVSVVSQNGYQLRNNGSVLNYRVTCDGSPVTNYDGAFKVFEMSGESCVMNFAFTQGTNLTGLPAGDYTDRLTFTITYLD